MLVAAVEGHDDRTVGGDSRDAALAMLRVEEAVAWLESGGSPLRTFCSLR